MVAVWPMAADGLSSELPVQRANTLYGGCRQHSLIVVALINPLELDCGLYARRECVNLMYSEA